jgi:hypothetical protein
MTGLHHAALAPALGLGSAGLSGNGAGEVVLSGALLRLSDAIDAMLLSIAEALGAEDHRFGALIDVEVLHASDYFRSFPQHATFPAVLDRDPANLSAFADGSVLDEGGALALTRMAPVRCVLTPAACYHVYPHLAGRALEAPLAVTTRNRCFRNETRYEPLRRQWCFNMRELVFVGSAAEVKASLDLARAAAERMLARLGLAVQWTAATDPFFQPTRSARCLMQQIAPIKVEAVYRGELALGSCNFHQDHFGRTYAIARDGRPSCSGCLAFGLERLLYAVIDTHGPDPQSWPVPAAT